MIVIMVKDVQRVYRGHRARRIVAIRLASVCKMQAWWRMLKLRRRFCRLRSAAELVQAVARGRNCRLAFLMVRELVILAQATVRGWLERRVAACQRQTRVRELRAQVLEDDFFTCDFDRMYAPNARHIVCNFDGGFDFVGGNDELPLSP